MAERTQTAYKVREDVVQFSYLYLGISLLRKQSSHCQLRDYLSYIQWLAYMDRCNMYRGCVETLKFLVYHAENRMFGNPL